MVTAVSIQQNYPALGSEMQYSIGICLFCWVAVSFKTVYTSASELQYKKIFAKCSRKTPILTFFNVTMDTCVFECQIRTACIAVNFWRVKKKCEMLNTDTSSTLHQDNDKHACVHIRKTDVTLVAPPLPSLCTSCDVNTTCDDSGSQCRITECRKLGVPNALNLGNILSVGSRHTVSCGRWFSQHPPIDLTTCQGNGTWDNVPRCEYLFDCKIPPDFPTSEPSRAITDNVTGELVVEYVCAPGFSSADVNVTMTIECGSNETWTQPNFECVIDCGEPPVILNSTLSEGGTQVNMTRNYTCDPGYAANDTAANDTAAMNVTCHQDGNWTALGLECVLVCPDHWFQGGLSCYNIASNSTLVIQDAGNACSSVNNDSYLLQLETSEENSYMIDLLSTYNNVSSWCLGLYHNVTWSWLGTSGAVTYANWAVDEPGAMTHAVIINNQWHGVSPDYPCIPVCERTMSAV